MVNSKEFQAADYRVRLFLSVDLSGSTAFKNSSGGLARGDDGSPKWVSVFRDFYREFPLKFKDRFLKNRSGELSSTTCAKLWKAIGDELVFCGRIGSKAEAALCVNSFIDAIHEYRQDLTRRNVSLDLKGAGWVAAFPEPNLAVRLRTDPTGTEPVSLTEDLESAADANPFEHDFLGKAIDTGFRIAATASNTRFAISVQLALLLLATQNGSGASRALRVSPPIPQKGVNQGTPYPSIYIETLEHLRDGDLHRLEGQLFSFRHESQETITDYLRKYCVAVGTEDICLPLNASERAVSPPASYIKLRAALEKDLNIEENRHSFENTAGEDVADDSGEEFDEIYLNPIPRDETSRLQERNQPNRLTDSSAENYSAQQSIFSPFLKRLLGRDKEP